MVSFRSIDRLENGDKGRICCLLSEEGMRRRLLDIGFCEDTVIRCVGCSPLGDPKAYLVRGAVIAVRRKDGRRIIVREE